jgi:hypothetical protein
MMTETVSGRIVGYSDRTSSFSSSVRFAGDSGITVNAQGNGPL